MLIGATLTTLTAVIDIIEIEHLIHGHIFVGDGIAIVIKSIAEFGCAFVAMDIRIVAIQSQTVPHVPVTVPILIDTGFAGSLVRQAERHHLVAYGDRDTGIAIGTFLGLARSNTALTAPHIDTPIDARTTVAISIAGQTLTLPSCNANKHGIRSGIGDR